MKIRLKCYCIITVLLTGANAILSKPVGASEEVFSNERVAEVSTAFAIDFFHECGDDSENLVFSPYSITTTLAMLYAGAGGHTKEEIGRVLHARQFYGDVNTFFGDFQRRFNSAIRRKEVDLDFATFLRVQEGYAILPSYLRVASKEYLANVK